VHPGQTHGAPQPSTTPGPDPAEGGVRMSASAAERPSAAPGSSGGSDASRRPSAMLPGTLPPVPRHAAFGKGGAPRTAQEVVAALALPRSLAKSPEPALPLPMPDLHRLQRDGSMLYGMGRVDASGRVANHNIVEALGWQHGDKLEVAIVSRAIVVRVSPDGPFSVPKKLCIVLPAPVRRHCNIETGDHVLLAAAPEFDVLIVHTLAALDDMLAEYHTTHDPTKMS
jgi:bifunctional DNA-binding transcriptional regulator/antitoxin component of YhaV-PrlF toxin-antitoxin module